MFLRKLSCLVYLFYVYALFFLLLLLFLSAFCSQDRLSVHCAGIRFAFSFIICKLPTEKLVFNASQRVSKVNLSAR